MNKPVLSIIIPVYNVERYIAECLDSILCQNDISYEIIIIDDHSTDKSKNICAQYEKKNGNVKLYSNKKRGVSTARNLGLEKASGDYIWFIDSDDLISDQSFKILKDKLGNSDLLIFGVKKFSKKHTSSTQYTDTILDTELAVKRILADNDLMGYLANKIFSRKLITKNSLTLDESISTCEDLLFCIQYLATSKTIEVISDILYFYRQRAGSSIKSKINLNQATALKAFLQIAESKNLPSSSVDRASALFIKAFYKYRPILPESERKEYQQKVNSLRKKINTIQPKDTLLIFGYRFLHPVMMLLHRNQYKNGDLYE